MSNIRNLVERALDIIADTWLPLGVVLMCFVCWLIGSN